MTRAAQGRDPPAAVIAVAIGIAIDLVVALSLLAIGWSLSASHVSGLLAGHAARALTARAFPFRASDPTRYGSARAVRYALVVALTLGLRGGVIATVICAGAPEWLAVAGGIAASWIVTYVIDTVYPPTGAVVEQSDESRWALAALGIIVYAQLLRIVYLGAVAVLPEEAYYWNYSIRPDLGYLDHPPMVAWLIAFGEALLGHGPVGVRFGSFLSGLVVAFFVFQFARRLVDRPSALMAAALATALPYFFFGSGLMMSPDAALAAAWAVSVYFFHRALVGNEPRAWYGVGLGIGLGMLSKYTIALLGPAALAFCLLDARARAWFRRPQPYLATLIALLLFAPVIYWNHAHDWASFAYQTGGRFGAESRISLFDLVQNIMVVATPLPLLLLPLLFFKHWTGQAGEQHEPEHAQPRNRLFVACFVFAPVLVFAWDALEHLPRINWTGPVWLTTLPLMGWAIVHAGALRFRGLAAVVRVTARPLLAGLLVLYAVSLHHVTLGIPGLRYPTIMALAIGAPEAARSLHDVASRLERESGAASVVVGMDKYWIASELSFYGTPEDLAAGAPVAGPGLQRLKVTSAGRSLGKDGLMFDYWYSPQQLRGSSFIMVSRDRNDLTDESLPRYFRELDPAIHPLPLVRAYGSNRDPIAQYYYRVGYEYRPVATKQ